MSALVSFPQNVGIARYLGLSLVVMISLSLGCATVRYHYPGHKTFTAENIEQLRVGMDPTRVQELFGIPDETYRAKFGADLESEWEGEVWIYFTELDSRYRYVRRYKKNVLVFAVWKGNLLLNHWTLEQ